MRTGVLVTAGAVTLAVAAADAVYRSRLWGASAREARLSLPGDDAVPEPAQSVTRGITVRACADEVWRAVEEFARNRGGVEVVPGRAVLLSGRDAWAVRSLHVLPVPMTGAGGPALDDRCRLITRRRVRAGGGRRVVAAVLSPVDLLLTRRLLLGLKDAAERVAGWTTTTV